MVQLFDFVRDKFGAQVPAAPRPSGFVDRLPPEDFDDAAGEAGHRREGDSVSGLTVIIEYRDGKGAESLRQVSCIQIEQLRGNRFLRAFCHTRRQQRSFRIDRIETVMDAETGEPLADGVHYFAGFADDRISAAPMGWGLSVRQRARLAAGLVVLVFLSRCDGHVHPAEIDEIESFVTGWWMRSDIAVDMPHTDILDHVRRLAPDVEAFVLAAERVRECTLTGSLVGGYVQRLIDADGWIAPEERHWVSRLIEWWSEA